MRRVNSVLDLRVFRYTIRLTISLCNNMLEIYVMRVYSISNYSLQLIIQTKFAELVNTGYKVNINVELIGKALLCFFYLPLTLFLFLLWSSAV